MNGPTTRYRRSCSLASRNLAVILLLAAACQRRESATPSAPPRFGLAVSDTLGAWCAEFTSDSGVAPIEPGGQVTIIFPGPGTLTAVDARVRGSRSTECWAAFAQPRWFGYTAYDLGLTGKLADAGQLPTVALLMTGTANWTRGPDGLVRADLDGDGVPEEARRCTADEGEHFTIWAVQPGRARRLWHEYYDWGAFTDPTCRRGENGLDSAGE